MPADDDQHRAVAARLARLVARAHREPRGARGTSKPGTAAHERAPPRPASSRVTSTLPPAARQPLGDGDDLLGRLALAEDHLREAVAQPRWWSTRAKPRSSNGSVRSRSSASSIEQRAALHRCEQIGEALPIHAPTG